VYVVATAGHVDHGKSTLVRALTGMEPDRHDEERRRGLTIDLGYAWTRLGDADLAFVDVPGHERFIATMLAGLGPAPAVMFVVAADEGWRRQSTEHLAAIDALGLRHGLLVVTRSDLADPEPTIVESAHHIARSSLGTVRSVAVSGRTGDGLPVLRTELARLVAELPAAHTDGRVRLWVDRSFVIKGAGTVVTGTLGSGRLRVGEELWLGGEPVRIRGLQSLGIEHAEVSAVARVAVNLRGVDAGQVRRGDALLTPAAWDLTKQVDARLAFSAGGSTRRASSRGLPTHLVAYLGTASVPVRVRPLDDDLVRLTFERSLPAEVGDRLVLRDPGQHAIVAGALVLDLRPPDLRRRGAAAARAIELQRAAGHPNLTLREGLVRDRLSRVGVLRATDVDADERTALLAAGAQPVDGWLVDGQLWQRWQRDLSEAVREQARRDPLDPRLSLDSARRLLETPERALAAAAAADAGLAVVAGWLLPNDASLDEPIRSQLVPLEQHLAGAPFAAPERPELAAWGLGARELAAAERAGLVVRLTPEIVLLPNAPALAMRTLAALPQPFTTSEARQALGTTRRVVVPLLEHLDRRGWTQRLDAGHRRVLR
jgi:selenocysteine-specific elongation factor